MLLFLRRLFRVLSSLGDESSESDVSMDDSEQQDTEIEELLVAQLEPCFINRLSTDILARILFQCLPTHDRDTRPSSLKVSEAPVVFGRVCSHWREVTYTTPALWSQVSVKIPRNDADRREEIIGRLYKSLELQMSLSKSCPLDITISSGPVVDVRKAYSVVIPHIRRWRSIHIDSYLPHSLVRTLFRLLSSGSPMLETFEFSSLPYGGIEEDEENPASLTLDFTRAPLLREIRMGLSEYLGCTRIRGPMQIHRTTIDFFMDSYTFLSILNAFPNTSSLECSVADNFELPENIIQYPLICDIRALKLDLLDYSVSPQGDGTRVFDGVHLPLLEDLTVDYGDPPNTLKFSVPKLIRRFGCSLKKLALTTVNEHFAFKRDILPILQLSPNLQELHLIGDVGTSIFDGLAGMSLVQSDSSGYSVLCPELVKLRLSVGHPAPYEALYALVSFRGQLVTKDSGNRGKNGGCITFVGNMMDLRDRPNVWNCFKRYGVKCALTWLDEGLPIDEYLGVLPQEEILV